MNIEITNTDIVLSQSSRNFMGQKGVATEYVPSKQLHKLLATNVYLYSFTYVKNTH